MIDGVPIRIVAPLVAAFVLFLGVVGVSARRPAANPAPATGWRPFLGRLSSTAVGGFAVYLLIVLFFHRLLAGQRDVMRSAVGYGTVLVFVIAVPSFVVLSFIEALLRRRRGSGTK